MKLLLLIVPAIFTVLVIVLSPIIEEQKFKRNLIGKTITVLINISDEEENEIEIYRTEGTIEKITNDTLEIKRKTQPNFRIPFIPENLSHFPESSLNGEYFFVCFVDSEKELDRNRGLLNS